MLFAVMREEILTNLSSANFDYIATIKWTPVRWAENFL